MSREISATGITLAAKDTSYFVDVLINCYLCKEKKNECFGLYISGLLEFFWLDFFETDFSLKSYVLIDWVGGPDGKIFGSRSWRTDRAQRGPCFMTESQIFSCPARPNSVNKHFIIWPFYHMTPFDPLFCVFSCCFFFRWATSGFVSHVFSRSQWYCAIHVRKPVKFWTMRISKYTKLVKIQFVRV